jgi:hypothetical protein
MVVIYRVLPQTSSSNLRRAYSDKLESQAKPRRYRIYAVNLVSISLDLEQEQNTSSTIGALTKNPTRDILIGQTLPS